MEVPRKGSVPDRTRPLNRSNQKATLDEASRAMRERSEFLFEGDPPIASIGNEELIYKFSDDGHDIKITTESFELIGIDNITVTAINTKTIDKIAVVMDPDGTKFMKGEMQVTDSELPWGKQLERIIEVVRIIGKEMSRLGKDESTETAATEEEGMERLRTLLHQVSMTVLNIHGKDPSKFKKGGYTVSMTDAYNIMASKNTNNGEVKVRFGDEVIVEIGKSEFKGKHLLEPNLLRVIESVAALILEREEELGGKK